MQGTSIISKNGTPEKRFALPIINSRPKASLVKEVFLLLKLMRLFALVNSSSSLIFHNFLSRISSSNPITEAKEKGFLSSKILGKNPMKSRLQLFLFLKNSFLVFMLFFPFLKQKKLILKKLFTFNLKGKS